MELIDLSMTLSTSAVAPTKTRIKRCSHRKGAFLLAVEAVYSGRSITEILKYLCCGRILRSKDFKNKEGLAWETVHTMTHRGTHMDAPYHYGSKYKNRAARTIDQVPLEWCYGDGVLFKFGHKKAGEYIYADEIQTQLYEMDYELKAGDIVLIETGSSKYRNEKKYLNCYPGLHINALELLLSRGIRVIGVDAYSLDRPTRYMVSDYIEKKDDTALWPTHFAGRDKEYCQIEQLAGLDRLKVRHGFKICCFPISIEKASAGFTRVVAIIDI